VASAEKLVTIPNRGKQKRGKISAVPSGGEVALSGMRGKFTWVRSRVFFSFEFEWPV